MEIQTVLPIVLLCVGAILILASIVALWPAIKLSVRGQDATGALVYWKHTFDQKFLPSGREVRKTAFYAIVRFQTADGSQHQVVSGEGHEKKPDWPIGHPFPIRYDPANPADATVKGSARPWVTPAAFLIVGAGVLIAAIYLWLSGR
jgi:hypothetical protein